MAALEPGVVQEGTGRTGLRSDKGKPGENKVPDAEGGEGMGARFSEH